MNAWQAGLAIALGLAAYLLGAVPFGLLIGFLRGVDVRTMGSRNIGTTNVFRCVGKRWGIVTFVLDALKGFVPAFFFPMLLARAGEPAGGNWAGVPGLAFMMLAIAGHNWPVWLRFKGGKGVATSAGALLGVAPLAVGAGFAAWAIVFAASHYVSLASIVAAGAVTAGAWAWERENGFLLPGVLTVLCALVILRHRANIGRLRAGTENRITWGRKRNS